MTDMSGLSKTDKAINCVSCQWFRDMEESPYSWGRYGENRVLLTYVRHDSRFLSSAVTIGLDTYSDYSNYRSFYIDEVKNVVEK